MLSSAVSANTLTIERIFESPSLDGNAPRDLKVSPDGQRVTFLKGKASDYDQLDLWEYHVASGKTQMLFDSQELLPGDQKILFLLLANKVVILIRLVLINTRLLLHRKENVMFLLM